MNEDLIKKLDRLTQIIETLREDLDSKSNYYPQDHEKRILLIELIREKSLLEDRLENQSFIMPMEGESRSMEGSSFFC